MAERSPDRLRHDLPSGHRDLHGPRQGMRHGYDDLGAEPRDSRNQGNRHLQGHSRAGHRRPQAGHWFRDAEPGLQLGHLEPWASARPTAMPDAALTAGTDWPTARRTGYARHVGAA